MNEVIVGRVGAPYGVHGWVHLQSFLQVASNIKTFSSWIVEGQTIQVKDLRPHGKAFVAKLDGINDRDQAALLTNRYIAVPREALPALTDDEFYLADLLQLDVFDQTNNKLGVITEIMETGANDVLIVTGADKKEHLIPYVPGQYVLDIDLENRKVLVDWEDLNS